MEAMKITVQKNLAYKEARRQYEESTNSLTKTGHSDQGKMKDKRFKLVEALRKKS